jgi:hypothetical protein
MTFDPTKPVQTRDGRKARIICVDRENSKYPIIALVKRQCGNSAEAVETYKKDGSYYMEDGPYFTEGSKAMDLINIPERRIMWTNVYTLYADSNYPTREEADKHAGANRIGVLKITCENDEKGIRLVDQEYEKLK